MTDARDEKCGNCGRKVQNGLQCDGCKDWYHNNCQGVPKDLSEMLGKYPNQAWFCSRCKHAFKNKGADSKRMEVLEQQNKELMDKLKEVTRKLDNMREEIKKEVMQQLTANEQTGVPVNEEDIVQKTIAQVIDYIKEEEDKNRRKPNLVMYNIPESNKEDVAERIDEDLAVCCDIIENSLGVGREEFSIKKVIRLGKPRHDGNNRNRPVLLKLTDEDEKWKIVKKAKNLKHESNPMKKRVGIALDLTKKERELETELRQELNTRRLNGESGLYIKNGKLCKARGARERVY